MIEGGDRYHRALQRGALLNLLGGIARVGHPLFLLVITRLWGAAFSGLYLLAQAMLEVVACVAVDGPADATLIFASRHVDAARVDDAVRDRLYRVLGTTVRVGLGVALPVALGATLFSPWAIRRWFPAYRELIPGLRLLGWTLLPRVISQMSVASTKALLRMEYDALLNGVAAPLLLLGGAALVHAMGGGLTALLAAQLGAEGALALLGMAVFCRFFSLRRLAKAMRLPPDRPVLHFTIPQALNLTFNRYIARLDGIMLASCGLGKAELGFFSTSALLTGLFAQIRMIWSGALAPVAARYHDAGERRALELTMGRVARWATALVVPGLLLFVPLRADILGLVSPDYRRSSLFVLVQLIPPFMSCAYGLAGACLMFTGHSRTTLANSVGVAALQSALLYGLVPRHGMLGAAVATAISSSVMTILQMIELYRLERVAIRWRAVSRPHLGLALGAIPALVAWDPARWSFGGRLLVAALGLAVYAIVVQVRFSSPRARREMFSRWRQVTRAAPPIASRTNGSGGRWRTENTIENVQTPHREPSEDRRVAP